MWIQAQAQIHINTECYSTHWHVGTRKYILLLQPWLQLRYRYRYRYYRQYSTSQDEYSVQLYSELCLYSIQLYRYRYKLQVLSVVSGKYEYYGCTAVACLHEPLEGSLLKYYYSQIQLLVVLLHHALRLLVSSTLADLPSGFLIYLVPVTGHFGKSTRDPYSYNFSFVDL